MLNYISAHNGTLTVKSAFAPKARKHFKSIGVLPSHMRIGRFSIATCDQDTWVAEAHEGNMLDYRDNFENTEHLASFTRGRIAQLNHIEKAIPSDHPMRDAVLAAVADERAYIA